jgi:7-keto-8-aminopelargonate synthetase-like enzyme
MTAIRPPGATSYQSLAHLRNDPRLAMLAQLQGSSPMLDAVIDEVRGRRIRVGGHWLADFASCNYLGFDLDPEIAASINEQVRRWGTHPSWSRLLGNPRLYPDIEERLTELLGAPDSLVLPTISAAAARSYWRRRHTAPSTTGRRPQPRPGQRSTASGSTTSTA